MTSNNRGSASFSSEKKLVEILVSSLVTEGYKVKLEASNMGQSVDIVASKGSEITLIEAKIYNWKRALEQCKAHRYVADYICVAVGSKSISSELLKAAENESWGVIHCCPRTGQCDWVMNPIPNEHAWMPERRRFIDNLKGVSYAG